ncbi:ssDNA-binding protein [Dubosiella newyorkensis]|uniref:ssDNA-binding protein n=1 Tax=Dubosiella newyorkensis TaxID=1862672 RepID=UPI00272D41B6|nr:ssDNA-binding protein [Dubosiella newyorkensis]
MAKRPEDVRTGTVRIVWPHLFAPYASENQDSEPSYSVAILIDKEDKKTLNAINAAYKAAFEAGVKKHGAKFQSKGKTPLIRPDGGNKGILIDCDSDLRPDSLDAEDVKGCYLMNLKRKNKPGVVAVQDGALVHLGEEDIQGGDYCQVTLSMYPYNHPQGGMGISKELNNVCKMSDGEPLGTGSASAESDFADMASASAFGSGDNDEDPFA